MSPPIPLRLQSRPLNSGFLLVSPHPDDEIIGAGSRLPMISRLVVLEVTDGSPQDLTDAQANGFSTRAEYARARKRELRQALALAGHSEIIHLDLHDQEATQQLTALTLRVRRIISELSPEIILTVPYEGGHPDHDATVFAVHNALQLLPLHARPRIIEMGSYHNGAHGCIYNSFLDCDGREDCIRLTPEECALKRRMFECFRTQSHVLKWFPIDTEIFRFAPNYNFLTPPHSGALYYEAFPWGMTGSRWRDYARESLAELKEMSAPIRVE